MRRILMTLLLAGFAPTAMGADWWTPNGWTPPDITLSTQQAVAHVDTEGLLTLPVEQAVTMALLHNPSLIAQKQQPIIAGTFAAVERARFDPTLFASAEKSEQSSRIKVGLRKYMPTGTTLELTLTRRTRDQRGSADTQAALTITQALLDGFGIATNLVALRQARTEVMASAYQLRGFVTALVADVESTYWAYLGARARIDILENALAVAERRAQATRKRIAAGAVAEIQRYAFAAEAARRRQALIDGRARAKKLRIQLLRLISPEDRVNYQRRIKPISEVKITELAPIDATVDYIKLAWQQRADLNQARLKVIRNKLQVKATQNGLLPRLDFFVRLGRTGLAGDDAAAIRGYGRDDTYDLSAGLQFEYKLGNRAAEARARRAKVSRKQALAALENLKRQIAAEVRKAIIEVKRAAAQIKASAATVRLRRKTLQAEQKRFEVGRSTALMVAQAQRDLLQARLKRLNARINYRQALIALHVADGTLLARRLIEAPGKLLPDLPWQE